MGVITAEVELAASIYNGEIADSVSRTTRTENTVTAKILAGFILLFHTKQEI